VRAVESTKHNKKKNLKKKEKKRSLAKKLNCIFAQSHKLHYLGHRTLVALATRLLFSKQGQEKQKREIEACSQFKAKVTDKLSLVLSEKVCVWQQ
jgi:hypothetical protein